MAVPGGVVRDNIEIAVLGVVAISLMPVAIEIVRTESVRLTQTTTFGAIILKKV